MNAGEIFDNSPCAKDPAIDLPDRMGLFSPRRRNTDHDNISDSPPPSWRAFGVDSSSVESLTQKLVGISRHRPRPEARAFYSPCAVSGEIDQRLSDERDQDFSIPLRGLPSSIHQIDRVKLP